MMARDYMWINGEREEMICALPDEQVGELYRDLLRYMATEKTPETFSTPAVKQAFETMLKDDAEMRGRLDDGTTQNV